MKYNWEEMRALALAGGPYESTRDMATKLGIPASTLRDAIARGDMRAPGSAQIDGMTSEMKENEAFIRFKAGEPLSKEQAMEVAGIDPTEWRVEKYRVNMWQMGRKDKEVQMRWEGGRVVDGFIDDSGRIHKTYLYQIEMNLTRKRRIAVKPVFQPVELPPLRELPARVTNKMGHESVLFVADPHFGFRRTWNGLDPIHHRRFLANLLAIAKEVQPTEVVWNGDALDMAEWGRFDVEPDLLADTQLAAIELAWLLGQFRRQTQWQTLLEGNHEVRLRKALVKNLKAAYQLKPVHDLWGEPLMSVPRLLSLKSIDTNWVSGYPDAHYKVGHVRFSHGSIVRKGSGKTASALLNEAAGSYFFGHIHRYELASKYVPELDREVWVGSPGCATPRGAAPGSSSGSNWQLGAFLVHLEDGYASHVEHITSKHDGPVFFRGRAWREEDYMEPFLDWLPKEWRRPFE